MKSGIDYIGLSVVFCCYDGNGKFFLQKRGQKCRDEQGKWEFGGGQIEFGETTEAAVIREMKEENNANGTILETLPPHTLFRENNGVKTHWILFPFIVLVNPQEIKLNEPEKFDQFGWFELKSFPTPLHPGLVELLKVYESYFSKYRKE